ncbi:MAG: hypothetical protein AAB541_00960 [Patescibacteria group bacterium]
MPKPEYSLEASLLSLPEEERGIRVVKILTAIGNIASEVADLGVNVMRDGGETRTTVAIEAQRLGNVLTSTVNETK